MKQKVLNDKLVVELTDKILASDKKEKYLESLGEVVERCKNMCDNG